MPIQEQPAGAKPVSAARYPASAAHAWVTLHTLTSAQVYPAGVYVFLQGSQAEDVYFVEDGVLKLIRQIQDGQEVIVDLRYAGQLSGASSVILRRPYPVTAVTISRCSLRRIPGPLFLDLLKADPAFCWSVLGEHSREIYRQYDHVAELGCCTARHRLEHFLWQLSESLQSRLISKEVRLQMPLKHWEMAQMLAITPSYLSRLLRQLEKEGALRRRKGWLILPNYEKLWHLL